MKPHLEFKFLKIIKLPIFFFKELNFKILELFILELEFQMILRYLNIFD